MSAKVMLISFLACTGLILAWYAGAIPESLAPAIFIIVFFVALHTLMEAVIKAWEILGKFISKK